MHLDSRQSNAYQNASANHELGIMCLSLYLSPMGMHWLMQPGRPYVCSKCVCSKISMFEMCNMFNNVNY